LKCRCPKWPRMNHLNICSTSYGRKKGRESNWQFDSRRQKVGNRLDSRACRQSTTHPWKALEKNYSFGLDLVPIRVWGEKLCASKVSRVQTRTDLGLHFGSWKSWDKEPFGCKCDGELQRILHGGRWWLPPSPGRGESSESKVARGLS